jgi:hypothetical protein
MALVGDPRRSPPDAEKEIASLGQRIDVADATGEERVGEGAKDPVDPAVQDAARRPTTATSLSTERIR